MIDNNDKYFTNAFSKETWEQKFKDAHDGDICATWKRVAKYLASVEKEPEKWEQEFYKILENHKFVTGGRIMANAGTGHQTTMINCFVSDFSRPDPDSLDSIYATLAKQASILKSEGGYGICISTLRPKGASIGGIASQSPGSVKFLELWDKSSDVITCGSGLKPKDGEKAFIRKGAQLVSQFDWHPDVVEFIEAKKTPGRLTKFNMSVLISDAFMTAVENDAPWELVFPNFQKYGDLYRNYWDANLSKWKRIVNESDSVIVYKRFSSARQLWDLIMENTYNRNEPGVLFIDTINKMNNLRYCEYLKATNACSEQPLPDGGVCLLGSLNVVHFINESIQDWDYEQINNVLETAVRMLDNVNDLAYVPLEEQRENLKQKRRIGIGIMGLGSAMLMMRVKYGSEKCLQLVNKLSKFIANQAYIFSSNLAKEKGCFPLFDREKFLASGFVSNLDMKTKMMIYENGMRNSHLLSIQPTGNTSCFANLVSNGCEPSFNSGYWRTSIQPTLPDWLELPKNIDWQKCTLEMQGGWNWKKEGDENLLWILGEDGKIWKYDQNRGITKEEWIEDFGVSWLKERGLWDESADWAKFAMDLTPDEHIDVITELIKYVDASISKTINVSKDIPYEDFKEIYKKCWKRGIKGFTTYREGTMAHVLATGKEDKGKIEKIVKTTAPKRKKELPCGIHRVKVSNEDYVVLIGLYGEDPYEIFVVEGGKDWNVSNKEQGKIVKNKDSKLYECHIGEFVYQTNNKCSPEVEALARITSAALRHGTDVLFLVQQLEKVPGDLKPYAKSMARVLKKYIPNGTKEKNNCPSCNQKDSIVRQEGCLTCKQCGYSKCS